MLASRLAALDSRKDFDIGVLAAKGLHLAHPGDAFLQVGVDFADLDAGTAEGLARLAREARLVTRIINGTTSHADQRVGPADR